MQYRIFKGDCREVMDKLIAKGVLFDSIVTDPPYELGFMGKHWDSKGVSFQKETWERCYKILKPGGHLLAFGGSRTFHRIAVAIEDAGFEIRDTIMWLYGSGFPKSLDVSKAIDKLERGVPQGGADPTSPNHGKYRTSKTEGKRGIGDIGQGFGAGGSKFLATGDYDKEARSNICEAAEQWQGWGTGLKPAVEPIVMARKPLEEKSIAENVLKYGTGAINIDGCRVEAEPELAKNWERHQSKSAEEGRNAMNGGFATIDLRPYTPSGRWPANVIHDGSAEATEGFDKFGETGNKIGEPYTYEGREYEAEGFINTVRPKAPSNYNDSGSPSRYFYCAKASKRDRNEGCEELEDKHWKMNHLGGGDKLGLQGSVEGVSKNNHPTVKPTDLMQYLCRLVTPPNGTVLDPFMGSGSTGKAAMYEGFNFVGIDMEDDYIEIAKARIEYAKTIKEGEELTIIKE